MLKHLSIYNLITLLRLPLALCYPASEPKIRVLIIFLAMSSDILDGYLARRHKATSQLGAFLDPLMDKLFACVTFGTLFYEGALSLSSIILLFSRDLVIACYGFWVTFQKRLKNEHFRSLISGKVITSLQILTLFALSYGIFPPPWFFLIFASLVPWVIYELFSAKLHKTSSKKEGSLQ